MTRHISSTELGGFLGKKKISDLKKIFLKGLFIRKKGFVINLEESIPLAPTIKHEVSKSSSSNFILFPRYIFESINSREVTVNVFLPRDNNYENISKKNLVYYGIAELTSE